ncbi:MAG TPA: hypothetical protein DF774_07620 [Rheinheimera sp.]|uniref:RDD family protein n=1 Tax=Rheinheimera sp. TaxID=1869214 RepID=UPI000ED385F8|nr:RDD family protein [Rheinheimera sp.]HCU65609.1 hypothetical protein [Rheinheimera sp.]
MEPTKAESDGQHATMAAETTSLIPNENPAHQELPAPQTNQQPQAELPATATDVAASDEPIHAEANSKKGQLASRTHRLLASLIDSFIHLLVFIPLIWFVGLDTFKNLSPLQTLLVALYSMTTYLLIHGYLLYHYGQTIGKSEFGMRIQLLNGEKASLQHVMLWRYLPIVLITFVPVIGQFLSGIFNVLLIFGKQRRCLHDYIAGTEVRYYYDMPQQSPPN